MMAQYYYVDRITRGRESDQVLIRCVVAIREVVVDHDVDALNVDASAEEVGGHEDALAEVLEGFKSGNALFLLLQ